PIKPFSIPKEFETVGHQHQAVPSLLVGSYKGRLQLLGRTGAQLQMSIMARKVTDMANGVLNNSLQRSGLQEDWRCLDRTFCAEIASIVTSIVQERVLRQGAQSCLVSTVVACPECAHRAGSRRLQISKAGSNNYSLIGFAEILHAMAKP